MSKSEIFKFLNDVIEGHRDVEEQVSFLRKFRIDNVNALDLAIFAEFLLKKMPNSLKMPGAIDVCGTGGSGLPRINTSTIASFILSELGVGVAKHGNKAASGRFGSFDLLEELGVDIGKDSKGLMELYKRKGLAFIFARNFHPVMKHFAEARAAVGEPTIFNILGPLLSPAEVKKQIIGTSFRDHMGVIAEACHILGKDHVMVVRGDDGLDEVTLSGKTKVIEMKDGDIFEYSLSPEDFGAEVADFDQIKGGDKDLNKRITMEILRGECSSRHKDLVFVNTALALKLAGVVEDLKEGFEMARGAFGIRKLESYKGNILNEIASTKRIVRSDRSFYEALCGERVSVIAEIKRSSPSKGKIFEGVFDAGEIAKMYEDNGASAISVLTDEEYFDGSFDYLREARAATKLAPVLCKDFVVNEYQIYKAREYGADAILLIAALLDKGKIQKFLRITENLGMDALVEVHDEDELLKVLGTDAKIIGINNRDLKTFKIDLETTNRLCSMIPKTRLVVSESGISSKKDVERLSSRVDAVLVGTSLMKSNNITKKLHEIT